MKTCQAEMMNICMVEQGDCVLVQHRANARWHGAAFPGGHVDPGESVAESMVRELQEETGLIARSLEYCGLVHWVHADQEQRSLIFCYRCRDFSGQLRDDPKEGRHEWVPRDRLRSLPLAPWFGEQLRIFEDDAVRECFYRYDDRSGKTVVSSLEWF